MKKKTAKKRKRKTEWRPKLFADFTKGRCTKCRCGSKFLADQGQIVTREFGPFRYLGCDEMKWTYRTLLEDKHAVSVRVEFVEIEEGLALL